MRRLVPSIFPLLIMPDHVSFRCTSRVASYRDRERDHRRTRRSRSSNRRRSEDVKKDVSSLLSYLLNRSLFLSYPFKLVTVRKSVIVTCNFYVGGVPRLFRPSIDQLSKSIQPLTPFPILDTRPLETAPLNCFGARSQHTHSYSRDFCCHK